MRQLVSRCLFVMVIVALPGMGCTETTNSPISTTSGKDQTERRDGPSQQIKPPTWTIKHRVRHDSGVTTVAMHPSGSEVAAGGILSPLVSIWDVQTGRLIRHIKGLKGSSQALAYSPDGKYLAFDRWKTTEEMELPWIWNQGEIQLLDTSADGGIVKTFLGHTDLITALAFDPRGKLLASGSNTGAVHGSLDQKTNQMVTKRNDDPIRIWDVETGMLVKELAGHRGDVKSLVFIDDGQILVSGSYDKTIKIWDVAGGALLTTMTGHGDFVQTIAVSQSARYLASGGGVAEIKIWERN